jgi:hypothetical protein
MLVDLIKFDLIMPPGIKKCQQKCHNYRYNVVVELIAHHWLQTDPILQKFR